MDALFVQELLQGNPEYGQVLQVQARNHVDVDANAQPPGLQQRLQRQRRRGAQQQQQQQQSQKKGDPQAKAPPVRCELCQCHVAGGEQAWRQHSLGTKHIRATLHLHEQTVLAHARIASPPPSIPSTAGVHPTAPALHAAIAGIQRTMMHYASMGNGEEYNYLINQLVYNSKQVKLLYHTICEVQDMFLSPEHNWGVTVQCPTPFHLLALCAVLNTRYDSVTAGLPHLHVEVEMDGVLNVKLRTPTLLACLDYLLHTVPIHHAATLDTLSIALPVNIGEPQIGNDDDGDPGGRKLGMHGRLPQQLFKGVRRILDACKDVVTRLPCLRVLRVRMLYFLVFEFGTAESMMEELTLAAHAGALAIRTTLVAMGMGTSRTPAHVLWGQLPTAVLDKIITLATTPPGTQHFVCACF